MSLLWSWLFRYVWFSEDLSMYSLSASGLLSNPYSMFSSRWSELESLDYEIILDDSPRDFLNLANINFLFQIYLY